MKFIFTFLSKLSFNSSKKLGVLIGLLLNLGGKDKRITTQNIDLCFADLSKKERQKIVKKSLIELGKSITESFFIWGNDFETNKKYITSITGLELTQVNRPTILLTPHFGAFELTGRIASLTRDITFLYKPAKNKVVDEMIFNWRNQGNLSMAPTTAKGVAQVSNTLKNSGMVGILPDQYPGKNGSVITQFFNTPVRTTTLVSKLSVKYSPKVILTYALRNPKGYELVFKEVDIKGDDIIKSAQKVNNIIEELVRKNPEQYLWNYKKFKGTYDYY
jgi:KDO2-lipid IV(A) lauroyltransferase